MKTRAMSAVRSCLILLLLLAAGLLALAPLCYAVYASSEGPGPRTGAALQDGEPQTPPPMQLTSQQKAQFGNIYKNAPVLALDTRLQQRVLSRTAGTSVNLLQSRGYTFPSNRNQGQCGNCWVWAGTGVMEQELYNQRSIQDTLSIQYFDSNYSGPPTNPWACCGGNAQWFTNYYSNTLHQAIPWSNANAAFADGGRYGCQASAVPAISTTPSYPFSSISAQRIPNSYGSDQAAAIASIKSVLDGGHAVYFAFYLTNDTGNNDWSLFSSFWNTQGESAIYSGGFSCGKSASTWAGHAVTCVGYDDSNTDPSLRYWIMMNSWGAPGNRPNGLFHMPMYYNYACAGNEGYNTEWWSIPVTFTAPVKYTLSTSVASGSGSITLNPSGGSYDPGTVVTITASNNVGYRFDHWSGTGNDNINPTTVTMDASKSVSAYFTAVTLHNTNCNFNGDSATEIAIWRSSMGQFVIRDTVPYAVSWGLSTDMPIPADYNGDGKTEIAIWRASTGQFVVRDTVPYAVSWGLSTDKPVPADYNGDGKAEIAIWRASTGQFVVKDTVPYAVSWGLPTDVPIPADYNGDGKAEIAVWRPSAGLFIIKDTVPYAVSWGTSTDVPVPADYNGDGKAEIAIWRPSTGQFIVKDAAPYVVTAGVSTDTPIPADYNGDGKAEIAVWRPSTGQFMVKDTVPYAVSWGLSTDIPLSR